MPKQAGRGVGKGDEGELLRQGWFLIKTHDLSLLLDELHARDADLADEITPLCRTLAKVYYLDRYPGLDLEEEDWPALREQVEFVESLIQQIRRRIESAG